MNEVLRDLLSFRLKGKRKFKRVFNKRSLFQQTTITFFLLHYAKKGSTVLVDFSTILLKGIYPGKKAEDVELNFYPCFDLRNKRHILTKLSFIFSASIHLDMFCHYNLSLFITCAEAAVSGPSPNLCLTSFTANSNQSKNFENKFKFLFSKSQEKNCSMQGSAKENSFE